jgi:hypothetical protein
MGLDLWFQQDVARILASVQETMAATMNAAPALDPAQAETYRTGFSDAIRTVAVAFGVAAPALLGGNGNRPTRSVQVNDPDFPQLQGW